MLSTALERLDEAEEHCQQALALEGRIPGPSTLATHPVLAGQMPPCSREPGDEDRARALLRTVADETSQLGMKRLCAQAEEFSER